MFYSFYVCFFDFFLWNKVLVNGRNVYCKYCGIYIKNNVYYINICMDEIKLLNLCVFYIINEKIFVWVFYFLDV